MLRLHFDRWTHFGEDNDETPNQCFLFDTCEIHETCNKPWSCFSSDSGCNYGKNDVPVVLGGIDGNGINVTKVEAYIGENAPNCGDIPDIPSDMAFKNRATASFDANIYGCGGESTNHAKPTAKCMVLDVLNKPDYNWKSSDEDIPPMPDARTNAAAIGAYGELYVFGGSNVTSPNLFLMSSVFIYNPEDKGWRNLDTDMEHARAGHCAILQKDLVFLIGGKTCGCDKCMTVDTYNITTKEWKTYSLEDQQPRMGHACTLYNNQIIVSGGAAGTDWTNILDDVISIDITPGSNFMTATQMSNLNFRRMSHGMAIYNDKPYVIGGHSTDDKYIDDNEILSEDDTEWALNGALYLTRSHFSVTELSSEMISADNPVGCP